MPTTCPPSLTTQDKYRSLGLGVIVRDAQGTTPEVPLVPSLRQLAAEIRAVSMRSQEALREAHSQAMQKALAQARAGALVLASVLPVLDLSYRARLGPRQIGPRQIGW